ncbi:hypothetical protein ABZY32_17245 [Nocardiopsis alba]|uniref:hypothetical protein n=1 Tax=Nocardiopsis alba TaxID=53437 RepID=UPI0033B0F34A
MHDDRSEATLTGGPGEQSSPSPYAEQMRELDDAALHEIWLNGPDEPLDEEDVFMEAAFQEIERRDHLDEWASYGIENGLSDTEADRFAEFVEAWDGGDLAVALTEFRSQA